MCWVVKPRRKTVGMSYPQLSVRHPYDHGSTGTQRYSTLTTVRQFEHTDSRHIFRPTATTDNPYVKGLGSGPASLERSETNTLRSALLIGAAGTGSR